MRQIITLLNPIYYEYLVDGKYAYQAVYVEAFNFLNKQNTKVLI